MNQDKTKVPDPFSPPFSPPGYGYYMWGTPLGWYTPRSGIECALISLSLVDYPGLLDRLQKGIGTLEDWPSDICVKNIGGPIFEDELSRSEKVISKRLADALTKRCVGEVSVHPIAIISKDGSVRRDYFMLYFNNPVECINWDLSLPNWFYPEIEIDAFPLHRELILDRAPIGSRRLFRIKRYPAAIVIREDLRSELEGLGFSGFGWRTIRISDETPEEAEKRIEEQKIFDAAFVEAQKPRRKRKPRIG